MTPRTKYVEEYDAYELVDEVEGVEIVFSRLDGPAVRSQIENAKENETAGNGSAPGNQG